MHRFRFHSEDLTIIIDPKSWDLFRYQNTRLISLSNIVNGGAQLELTLKISLIGIEFSIFFNCFLFDFLLYIHVLSIAGQAKTLTRSLTSQL
jgi:hypothetical protein